MYIRFVVGAEGEDPRVMHGLFTEVQHLKKEGVLALHEEELAESVFEKFNNELPCPPWSTSNWPSDAISWFKTKDQKFISEMYVLIDLLREHEIQVRVLKSDNLFKIFYEDEFQVIALDKRF